MKADKVIVISIIAVLVIGGFAVGAFYLLYPSEDITEDVDLLDRNMQPPDWEFQLSNDSTVTLHSFRGRYMIVDLMATWCGACEDQNENFMELYESQGDSIWIVSLTVDISETPEMMNEYKNDRGLPWDHGVDTDNVFADYFNIQYVPSIIILDDNGYVRWFHIGLWSESDLADTLTDLRAV
ncbi:MAG: TlpA family protein disulfide reductase [Candidatus Hodarchaeota archaeon]